MNWTEYKEKNFREVLPDVMEIIKAEKLDVRNRTRHIAHQRFYLMWFLRNHTGMTLTAIGALFNRGHDMVIHAIRYHDESMQFNDKVYKTNVAEIKNFLEEKFEDLRK